MWITLLARLVELLVADDRMWEARIVLDSEELAAGADWIVANNVADFRRADLRFPQIGIIRPGEFLREIRL